MCIVLYKYEESFVYHVKSKVHVLFFKLRRKRIEGGKENCLAKKKADNICIFDAAVKGS